MKIYYLGMITSTTYYPKNTKPKIIIKAIDTYAYPMNSVLP